MHNKVDISRKSYNTVLIFIKIKKNNSLTQSSHISIIKLFSTYYCIYFNLSLTLLQKELYFPRLHQFVMYLLMR